jgi:hypothetical protein
MNNQNLRELSKLDIIIISRAIVNTWNQNMNGVAELFETKKNNYIKIIIDIIYQLNQNKSVPSLIIMLYDITMVLNDNIKYFSDNPGPVPVPIDFPNLQNLPAFNNLFMHIYPNIMDIAHINMNWKLYDATCKLFTNFFNVDSAQKDLKKIRYFGFLNENLSKISIDLTHIFTVNKAISAYIRMNNPNNPVVNPGILILDTISKNKIIKLLGTRFSISNPESFEQLNNIFINNLVIPNQDNEIIYPLFYDIINMFIE